MKLLALFTIFIPLSTNIQVKEHITIICHAGTEVQINEPNEYPAWSIECDDDNYRVIIVD